MQGMVSEGFFFSQLLLVCRELTSVLFDVPKLNIN